MYIKKGSAANEKKRTDFIVGCHRTFISHWQRFSSFVPLKRVPFRRFIIFFFFFIIIYLATTSYSLMWVSFTVFFFFLIFFFFRFKILHGIKKANVNIRHDWILKNDWIKWLICSTREFHSTKMPKEEWEELEKMNFK